MIATVEAPITFKEPSYALFDVALNCVRTTNIGNLAIFSTRNVAEIAARQIGAHIKVIRVQVSRLDGVS